MKANVRAAQGPDDSQPSRPAVSDAQLPACAASNTLQEQPKVSAPRELTNTSEHDRKEKGRKRAASESNATQTPPVQRRRLNTSDPPPLGTVATVGNPNDDEVVELSPISRPKHPNTDTAGDLLVYPIYKRSGVPSPNKAPRGGQKRGMDWEANSDPDDADDEYDRDDANYFEHPMPYPEEEEEDIYN